MPQDFIEFGRNLVKWFVVWQNLREQRDESEPMLIFIIYGPWK